MKQKFSFFKSMLTVLLLAQATLLSAQSVSIRGTILDQDNQPLAGVTVMEQGTMNGTATDLDGKFEFRASGPSAQVEISCIGFRSRTFAASELASMSTIVLEVDSEMVEEAVVIGYGDVKKEDLTGSVSVIKADEINRGSISDSYELLRGKSSGVMIIPGNGAPGSGAQIRIRGAASLNASNNPLLVVDGVTITHGDLSMINPDDIDSFTILKDASATAIYGSRASNGVILVTTKKGALSGLRISYNGTFSLNQNSSRLDMMSASEFRSFLKERFPDQAAAFDGGASTDWQDEVTKLGISTTHTLSVAGNTKTGKFPWRVSGGYSHEGGTIVGSYNNRGTVNASITPSLLDDHLQLTLSFNGSMTEGYNRNVMSFAARFNPTMPVHFTNSDGSIDYSTLNGWFNYGTGKGADFAPNQQSYYQEAENPVGRALGATHSGARFNTVLNAKAVYKIHGFEDLKLTASYALESRFSKTTSGDKVGSYRAALNQTAPGVGTYNYTDNKRDNTLIEIFANYNHDFSGHKIDAMAGYTWNRNYTHNYSETRFADVYQEHQKDEVFGNPTTNDQENILLSFFGRLNYSFKSRYLFTFTLRDDASSRFSPKNRWGLFPSVALAWNLAEENFIKQINEISTMKIRLGWGVTGQQDIGSNYPYIPRASISTSVTSRYNMGDFGDSYYLTPAAYDPNIKWEETTTKNVGLDLGFLKDRITASFDWYQRDTKDLLNSVYVPFGINFSNTLLTNVGSIRNKGFEFTFNFIPVSTRDWNVSIGLNGTFQSTKFTKLTTTDDPNYGVPTGQISATKEGHLELHKVGYAPYSFYCYQQAYDADGNPVQNAAVDRNGDGIITDDDRYMVGKKPAPDFFGGINFKVSYKQWDFGFNGHGSIGNYLFNDINGFASSSATDFGFGFIPNFHKYVLEHDWRAANVPAQSYSDMFLEDASFFRMDDINLGYTFKTRKWNANYRLAFSVQNAFVITKYSGMDPEGIDATGIDTQTTGTSMSNVIFWPRPRVYSLRLTIKF